ncbi:MAG: NAD(P)-dependent oxidoreductase [Eubacteriales bacterium]|nr:NAD(P)-dependent oxidoreductase [Eubacteriales bacterium]
MQRIAMIGMGVMGRAMAANLLKAGYALRVYTRTAAKAQEVVSAGALWCDTIADCVADAQAVITIVGYPRDVEEVYFGPGGILCCARPGAYLIDMTTTSPKLSRRIAADAAERGLFALDAPVSGGDVGARNATLSIMVGGDAKDYHACRPLLAAMGSRIVYAGPAGCGQHTKMANQIALGGVMAGLCEALAYARGVGLDAQTMLDSVSHGAAGSWQMTNTAPRILKGDFEPGFFIKHYIKDMAIASEEAQAVQLDLGVLSQVLDMYRRLEQQQMGDLGTQALIKYYDTDF